MELSKPVVGEGELVALDLDSMGGQGVEVRHPQYVKFPAVINLDTKHGDSFKFAGKH